VSPRSRIPGSNLITADNVGKRQFFVWKIWKENSAKPVLSGLQTLLEQPHCGKALWRRAPPEFENYAGAI
jgi:hypothetical protein